MSDQLWAPSEERIHSTNLYRFARLAEQNHSVSLPDYDAIWDWSLNEPEAFWQLVWEFCGIIGENGGGPALRHDGDLIDATFFPNARLNFAENFLRQSGDGAAIIFHAENGTRTELSWDQLRDQVSRTAQALKAYGITPGDRVAGFMPNMAQTIVAMLATTSLGGVWSSCSPDFGVTGVSDRFGQIEPKVLFTANGYYYNGKSFDSLATVSALLDQMPSVTNIVVVPLTEDNPDISALGDKGILYPDLLGQHPSGDIQFQPMDFNAPVFIMFSSGTTGVPKCIVHRAGGVLLQHLKEHQLQCDVRPNDRVFYFTTCGWMMWNWLVSGLASGATVVLFDGSPFHPDAARLADIVAQERITHFGTSAKYLDACAKADLRPIDDHDLTSLRAVLSTGSVLSPEGFDYVYDHWKKDVCLSSIAGGTDIVGCFAGGSPISPVYRGECQKRHLGMDVQAFDDGGKPTTSGPGELVCRSPHPTQPLCFWNDEDGSRYRKAYYETYPGVWHHGDMVEISTHGGVIFHGRSDATLNPGGVRIGTAEIYRQVERIEAVLESVVIGQTWDDDVRVVLFVKLRDGVELDDDLIKRIKTEIRTNTTPRHVPAKVLLVTDIPRTKSGKITELAVRDVVHGRSVKNVHALANPEALDLFKNRSELND